MEEFQMHDALYFPANIAALEERLAYPEKYEESGSGIVSYSHDGDEHRVVFTDATPEESEQVRELIWSLDRMYRYNPALMDIIQEEAVALFYGDKSAAETARVIQNRVSTYLGEQG
jgi:hypothetical protein